MTDLRTIEKDSIRAFVQKAADEGYLSGRVLDYGCGKQPYRDIVEAAGGEYVGYDRSVFPANVGGEDMFMENLGNYQKWDTILCNQVVQYVPIEQDTEEGDGLQGMLSWICSLLQWYDMDQQDPPRMIQKRGHLVLTYPTTWPEIELEDLHRFTKAGMERLLVDAGFEIVKHERRAEVYARRAGIRESQDDVLALGYGCVARA